MNATSVPIHGTADPRFEKLKSCFAANFADDLDHGASVAVTINGKPVANLWAGHADKAKTRPWQQDTLVNIWSVTKGIVALAVAMLVQRGLLRYDAAIAKVWPEFAAGGKEAITLDQVLSHTAGLNGLRVPMNEQGLYAWTPYVQALAAMPPNWQPGSRCAYHALTYGHLAGELLHRVTGQSVGQFITENIAKPLGVDFYVGLPQAEDHRAAEMIEGPKAADWVAQVLASPCPESCANPTPRATAPNDRAWRAAEIPGGNGHTTARALATIYGDIVSGASKLISTETLAEASRIRYRGHDSSFDSETVWGAGFRLEDEIYGVKASKKSIGHGGWGGAFAFGDPEAKLGFAYVTNHMLGFDDGLDPRRKRLVEAVYEGL